jgi:hypothetical protein
MNGSKIFLICVFFFFAAVPAAADTVCQAEISFKWKHAKEDAEETVPWVSVQQAGADETAAKAALSEFIEVERAKARAACEEAHQNLSRCIASKYAAMSSVMQGQTFSARKAFEDAISKDCERDQGTCGEVTASDPKCTERKASGPEQGGEKKDTAKDKGAKAKK